MSYGLDFTECRFVTDHKGNRLRADIPYNMFSMLVEFRQAALRAQTEQIEKSVRPGTFKGSLGSVVETPLDQQTSAEAMRLRLRPRSATPNSSRDKLEALFDAPPKAGVSESTDLSCAVHRDDLQTASAHNRHVFFPREFRAPIPPEVADAIANGTYFLRAWREYRKYKAADSAELTQLSVATITWHEQGYNAPSEDTLKRFANIYDCSIEQLTGVSNSLESEIGNICKINRPAKTAPIETDYPDTVLDHIVSGKSPITAWRIFRGVTEKQLAERYGTSVSLLQRMTENDALSDKTLDKFAALFHCLRDQLRRPEGLVVEPHKVRPASAKRLLNSAAQLANVS